MSRAEFMESLKRLLSDLPRGEIEEALNYYENYFDDAGAENEQEVIESLGTPEKVAKTIQDGLNDSAGEAGEFSETGFHGYGEEKKEEVGYRKKSFGEWFKGKGKTGLILALVFAILILPTVGPILIGIASAIFAVFLAIAAVLCSVTIAGIALIVAGAALFIAAVPCLFAAPVTAMLLFGASLLLAGLGILLAILGIWILCKILPPLFRWIVKKFQTIFAKKENDR